MLSKKYYEVFAEILKESKTKDEVTAKLITFFVRDNPRFDIHRFCKAAGVI